MDFNSIRIYWNRERTTREYKFKAIKKYNTYEEANDKYSDAKTFLIMYNGVSTNSVDIAIFGDGYERHEMNQFESDAKNATKEIFETHPFNLYKG